MSRWFSLGVVSILLAVVGPGPAWAQEPAPANGGIVIGLNRPRPTVHAGVPDRAAMEKLHGPVHTVQEETWDYEKKPGGVLAGSRYAVYDGKGHLLEDSRYGADGAVLMHTKITRDEYGRPLTREISHGDAGRTRVNTYDRNGLATVTSYDDSGTELNKTQMHTSAAGDTTYTMRAQNQDGSVSEYKSTETTDPATRTKQVTDLKDGRPERQSLTQQNQKGEMQAEAMLFGDGTSVKRETLRDGSVKTHFFHPGTKTNIYKTTDKQHRLTELVEDAPDHYTKNTYRYDGEGRMTETASFDRRGMQTGKSEMTYQVDGFGNWTEQKTTSAGKVTGVVKRVISYY